MRFWLHTLAIVHTNLKYTKQHNNILLQKITHGNSSSNMDTPLHHFLQGIIREKSAEFANLDDPKDFIIVVDNASTRLRSIKQTKPALDVSNHSQRTNRWSAEAGDADGRSPVPLPSHDPSPQLVLRKRSGTRHPMTATPIVPAEQ